MRVRHLIRHRLTFVNWLAVLFALPASAFGLDRQGHRPGMDEQIGIGEQASASR